MGDLDEELNFSEIDERKFILLKRKRRPSLKLKKEHQFDHSCWGIMLKESTWREKNSREGEKFERRFRVTVPMFDTMVKDAKTFRPVTKDCCGQSGSPRSFLSWVS